MPRKNVRVKEKDGNRNTNSNFTSDLEGQLAEAGLALRPVTGDGNCLFRSLSHQMYGNESDHSNLRSRVCNHLCQKPDLYSPFLVDEQMTNYAKRMAQNGTFGGNIELVAFCREFNVDIAVHQTGFPVWLVQGDSKATSIEPKKLLHLVFHPETEHYDSVVVTSTPVSTSTSALSIGPTDGPPNSMEKMVMKAAEYDDLARVRLLIMKYRSLNKVVELLWEEKLGIEATAAQDEDSRVTISHVAFGVDAGDNANSDIINNPEIPDENGTCETEAQCAMDDDSGCLVDTEKGDKSEQEAHVENRKLERNATGRTNPPKRQPPKQQRPRKLSARERKDLKKLQKDTAKILSRTSSISSINATSAASSDKVQQTLGKALKTVYI